MDLSPLAPVFLEMAIFPISSIASLVNLSSTLSIPRNEIISISVKLLNCDFTEKHLILGHESVLGFSEDPDEHLLGEGVEGDEDGEPAHELWDHPELDEVLGLHHRHVAVPLLLVLRLAAQAPLLDTMQASVNFAVPKL